MPVKTKRSGVKLKLDSLTPESYEKLSKPYVPARPVGKNCIRAFLAGGLICLIGQGIQEAYMAIFGMSSKVAASPTVATLILISVILTCFGVYDKMAQWAGAGTAVPVTGFANSMCSAALEHRAEGLVLGVGGNMFKLAGSVIVFGTVAAFIVGVVYALMGWGGAH
ncbi:stage V sporulation protein AC [Bacillus sp. FJAT-27264]|uniref:stage V sporulation protein AC n=1 Tax=Paenibacillus sp. (strain DSM 101736 / FJAT-27264) TaxID=1850362 RepID=UPI000807CA56|nr:stage V sporulation protein AC [Bacillus sp. FJAT-27264]OBZ11713.1 stage V sporulation protein AC [Bacillus sp. FJAT-27264]